MAKQNHLIVRGKDFLPALLLLQLLPAAISVIAFFMIPPFPEIFADLLGEDAELPLLTNVVIHTYLLWALIPLVLVALSFWVCMNARTIAGPMLVLVISSLVPFVLFVLTVIGVFLPLIKIVTNMKM